MKNKILGAILFLIALIFTAYSPIVYKVFCTEYNLVREERMGPFFSILMICILTFTGGAYLISMEERK